MAQSCQCRCRQRHRCHHFRFELSGHRCTHNRQRRNHSIYRLYRTGSQ
ncbi:MAG: PAN domain-containing protein [Marinicella pacifica]